MKRLSKKTYKVFFVIAAIWNISGGLGAIFMFESNMISLWGAEYIQMFYDNRVALSTYRLFWVLVIIFGVGYYVISRDLTKNRAVIWMAVAGKLTVFSIWSYDYSIGAIQPAALFGGVGDLIFTLIFLFFLWQTRSTTTF
jgi:hypothetical protein